MNKIIRFLLQRNETQSKLFCSPDVTSSRRLYRAEHPTEVIVFKCMDGRLEVPVITETPVGIIQPFRNIGAKFDLGWPYLNELIRGLVDYAVKHGRRCLIFTTYHFSEGNQHRGCGGFNGDTTAAMMAAKSCKKQLEQIFGEQHSVVHPVLVGIETDKDALIFHSDTNGDVLKLADCLEISDKELVLQVENLYPSMKSEILKDLLPLMYGNIRHIQKVSDRKIETTTHQERILAIGRGFDWLHLPNQALIIGPYSFDLREPIIKAANILLDNLRDGRISEEDGVVLFSSGVYRDQAGPEQELAKTKAQSLSNFAWSVIQENVPDLCSYVHFLKSVVNQNTRLMTVIE